jgi:hypothetical protein
MGVPEKDNKFGGRVVEIRRIMVQGQPGHKVSKTPSQQKSWARRHTAVIPATWELLVGSLWSRLAQAKS